jgi:hypothetical protein
VSAAEFEALTVEWVAQVRRLLDRACRRDNFYHDNYEYIDLVLLWLERVDPHLRAIYDKRLELAHPPQPLDEETLRRLAYFDLKAAYQEQGLPHPAIVAPQAVRAIHNAPPSCFKPAARMPRPRASRGRPIRHRGSRRTCAPTRGDPDPDGDPEPPALAARRQPVTGKTSTEYPSGPRLLLTERSGR